MNLPFISMNMLKRALSKSGTTQEGINSRDGLWSTEASPYLGTYIFPRHTDEYDWETYFKDDVNIKHKEEIDNIKRNRAISDSSFYNYIFGIPRPGFDVTLCDIIGSNPYYILAETIVCNYLRSVEFDVTDKHSERVDYAYKKLEHPTPQSTFWDEMIPMVRDLLRYDQGVLVKTFTSGGWLDSFKAYRGPEFWAELDNMVFNNKETPMGRGYGSYMSHGYITRWWQHTAGGLYIPFQPEEVVRFMLYPNAGSVYGTDIMKHFRFHFKGLMSGTVAYGKIMDNGLVTNLVFKHPDIGSRESLRKRLAGVENENIGASNFGKVLHLLGNEDVQNISCNLADMQYIDAQKFGITIVANLFGIPVSEFSLSESSQSRSSASTDKDIRNTRMLATLLTVIESKINSEILPHVKGYEEGWTFKFKKLNNLDDELKKAYVTQQNMSSLMMALQMGLPMDVGMKITQFGQQLTAEERDRVMEITQQNQNAMVQMEGSQGRYDGNDYESTFMGYKSADLTKNEIRSDTSE